MEFSLAYFANREVVDAAAEYRLLARTAKFADDHGYAALWLPERHFHAFGGGYPNPAVTAAALSMVTRRIRLRAGSVVLPLHDPLRIVEDWSVVDNLSDGRVDIALATGWAPNDFVLAPARFADRREILFENVPLIRALWAGDPVVRGNGDGAEVEIRTYPRPVQPELDMWITCTSNPATFVDAGRLGLNILTGLLFQSVKAVKENIQRYRAARREAGFDPAAGRVTLMVHAFCGESDEQVRAVVKAPFQRYLRSSFSLWQDQWENLNGTNADQLVEFAFARYFRTAALFGSVQRCVAFAESLQAAGVDEVACLVDFGVTDDEVLDSMTHLGKVLARMA